MIDWNSIRTKIIIDRKAIQCQKPNETDFIS